jgi:hypothetical protein
VARRTDLSVLPRSARSPITFSTVMPTDSPESAIAVFRRVTLFSDAHSTTHTPGKRTSQGLPENPN